MSNLYEILEVSEKASKEVIEKAYKVLAKKYHPDLQKEGDKENAEIKMKQINEAYEILSDDERRNQYDIELQAKREEARKKEIENEVKKNIKVQEVEKNIYNKEEGKIENYKNNLNRDEVKTKNDQKENMKILQNEIQRAYANAYNDYLRSLGYKIKQPWTLKRFIELLKVLTIITIIIAIIWFFPPTNKLIINFYEQNVILKAIINIIVGLWNGIGNFIINIFSKQTKEKKYKLYYIVNNLYNIEISNFYKKVLNL